MEDWLPELIAIDNKVSLPGWLLQLVGQSPLLIHSLAIVCVYVQSLAYYFT